MKAEDRGEDHERGKQVQPSRLLNLADVVQQRRNRTRKDHKQRNGQPDHQDGVVAPHHSHGSSLTFRLGSHSMSEAESQRSSPIAGDIGSKRLGAARFRSAVGIRAPRQRRTQLGRTDVHTESYNCRGGGRPKHSPSNPRGHVRAAFRSRSRGRLCRNADARSARRRAPPRPSTRFLKAMLGYAPGHCRRRSVPVRAPNGSWTRQPARRFSAASLPKAPSPIT